jgi:hypothetical protein
LESSLWLSLAEFTEQYRSLKGWLHKALRAKTEMVEANLGPSFPLRNTRTGPLDLIQEGNMGLMKAVEKFIPAATNSRPTPPGDSPGDHPLDRRSSATIRPVHMIETINKLMRAEAVGSGIWTRADAGRGGGGNFAAGGSCAVLNGTAAHFAPITVARAKRRTFNRQRRGKPERYDRDRAL